MSWQGDLYHVEGAPSPWGSIHNWVDQHPDLVHGDVYAIIMWQPKTDHPDDSSEGLLLVWTVCASYGHKEQPMYYYGTPKRHPHGRLELLSLQRKTTLCFVDSLVSMRSDVDEYLTTALGLSGVTMYRIRFYPSQGSYEAMPQDQVVERDTHTTRWYDCNWGSDNRVWVVSRQGDLYHVKGASDGALHGGTHKGDLYHAEGALSPWGSVREWVDQHPDLDHGDVHAIVMWRPKTDYASDPSEVMEDAWMLQSLARQRKMTDHSDDPSVDLLLVWMRVLYDAIQEQRNLLMA